MHNDNTLCLKDHPGLKMIMLNWANRFNIFCFLDSNQYDSADGSFECLLGAGCVRSFSFPKEDAFDSFRAFYNSSPAWLFGHLGYNAAGNAYSDGKIPEDYFGRGFFFEPEFVLRIRNGTLQVLKSGIEISLLLKEIVETPKPSDVPIQGLKIKSRFTKETYLEKLEDIGRHIKRGDCYEINFCQQFFCDDAAPDPLAVYKKLTAISPAPFAAFYKLNDAFCLCASPERFLKKNGTLLTSSPIKGTIRRDTANAAADEAAKQTLYTAEKDRSENVMIVDLVRNDLSRVCEKGSVHVTELFSVHSFPQVHHLISTIEGNLAKNENFTKAIAACFPPGSMTGAPKKRVMELIADAEEINRGLFSGSIGYITPDGDFDLNVVIRSIFLNASNRQLSFFAGGGITFYSDAEAEFDECLAKAEAIMEIFGGAKK